MEFLQMRMARYTHNYAKMLQFYGNTLGLKQIETWDDPENQGTIFSCVDKVGSIMIEIITLPDEAAPVEKPVNLVLSFEVPDVDAWHAELVGRGVPIARALENAAWGERSFGVDDPDGLRVWFHQDIQGKDSPADK